MDEPSQPYRSPGRRVEGEKPRPREERHSTVGLLLLALVPLVGIAVGARFSGRELMVAIVVCVFTMRVLVRRSRPGGVRRS